MSRLLLLALVGCASDDAPPAEAFAFPANGQTGVASTAALTVVGLQAEPLPGADLVRVVDLDAGGHIAGTATLDSGTLRFVPDAPWPAGHRFAWSLDPGVDLPHGPQGGVQSDSPARSFSTDDAIAVLAATRDARGVCAVLSRELPAATEPALYLDGARIVPERAEGWDIISPRRPTDIAPLQVWCAPGLDGQWLRLRTEGGSSSLVEISYGALEDALAALYGGHP